MLKTNVRVGRKNAPAAAGAPAEGQHSPPHAAPKEGEKKQEEPKDQPMTADEVKALIGETVVSAIKQELPEHMKGQVTLDKIQVMIVDAVKELKGDSTAVKREDLEAIVGKVAKRSFEDLRREKVPTNNPADAGRGQIEMPISWTKGNLPLHGKQLLNILMKRGINHGVGESDLRDGFKLGEAVITRMRYKALTSTAAGSGDEFVPSDLSSELQRRLYLASNLVAALAGREIDMPTQPYNFPLSTTRPTFYLESAENTAKTESTPGTGGVTLNARLFAAKVLFSYEVDEDSLIPILPWLQGELAASGAETLETALVNGDDSATHQDSDIHAVAKHAAKAWKGFRKLSLAITALKLDAATGGIVSSNIRSLIKLLGKYGINKRDLLLVVGAKGESDLLGDSNVLTVDKVGPEATILTGKVPMIFGVKIITSAAVREDLNATGVYDDTTTTKGSYTLVHAPSFMLGRRREFMIETEKDIDVQQTKVVASFRKAFSPVETPSAVISSVATAYNYNA